MKIGPASIPESGYLHPAAQGQAPHSFARLLEDGASAGAVLANRALSFSEVGLFGVHFATSAPARPPEIRLTEAESDLAGPETEKTSPTIAKAADPGPQQLSLPSTSDPLPSQFANSSGKPNPTKVQTSDGKPVQRDIPHERADHLHRSEMPRRRPAEPLLRRHRLDRELIVYGEDADLTLVAYWLEASEPSISNVIETAQNIASEYKMSVRLVRVGSPESGSNS